MPVERTLLETTMDETAVRSEASYFSDEHKTKVLESITVIALDEFDENSVNAAYKEFTSVVCFEFYSFTG